MAAPQSIVIRFATTDDAPAIAGILHRSFAQFRAQYTDGGFAATTLSVDEIRARLDQGPTWLAILNRQPVGTVSAMLQSATTAYMRGMAVSPDGRGSGIGSRMLKEVEQWAAEQGCMTLALSTTPFLHEAIRMYEKSGFQFTTDGPNDLFGTPLLGMSKQII